MRLEPLQRVLRGLATAGLLFLSGCGRDSPAAPNPGLSGPVVLVGYLTDSLGRFVGTRVVADADGIPVELVSGTDVVATTTTVKGRYTFTGLQRGAYVTRTRVTPDLVAETHLLTVTDALVSVADTLRLRSRGDLYPYPNPFRGSVTTSFVMPVSEQASLRVLDRSGAPVRTLLEGRFPQGQNSMPWDGTDVLGAPVASGFYWLTLSVNAGTRVQLLFRR